MSRYLLLIPITIVLLLVPPIFKDRSHADTIGPDLSDLEYSEISFENTHEDVQLAGMLFLPEGDGPFPTAVFIHGSGPSARNSAWYLGIAKYLQANGVAVLLPDKRGCEKSGGNWRGASIEDLATDFQVKVYPGGGHGIDDPQTHETSAEYLNDLVRFIKEGR